MSKKHKHLDDFFDELAETHSKDLEKAFKNYDTFSSDETQHNLTNDIIHPAMDEFYNTFVKELDSQFGEKKDAAKTHNKKKELKAAAVAGLKKFFEKTQPSALKAIEDIEDLEEQYDVLVHLYDINHGLNLHSSKGKIHSFREFIEDYSQNKKGKVGDLKSTFYHLKSTHAQGHIQQLGSRAASHYFSGFRPLEVGAHVRKKLKGKDIEVDDKVAWAKKDIGDFLKVYETYVKNEGEKGFEEHGLRYKKKQNSE